MTSRLDIPSPLTRRAYDLIRDPLLNKGSAFTEQERVELLLDGLLPSEVNSIALQAQRIYQSISRLPEPLDRYVALAELQDRNEYLFYRVLCEHLEEFMPVVYTPTVGLATQNFSQVFRRGRGLWITPAHRGRIESVLRNASAGREVRLIVATDNEAILGIGDQGAGGMAISVGKLSLYVAGAGIDPASTLPISLDVGTDNAALHDDPLYLGWRAPRLRGSDYDALLDEFVGAVKNVFPGALLQWEDFRKDNALALLDRHRCNLPSFNDDIQGTGAVALAGILSALRVTGGQLGDQRILIHGAGAAGLGIARQLKAALLGDGLDAADVCGCIGVLDSGGLLVDDRTFRDAYKAELAWPAERANQIGLADPKARDLAAVVDQFKPTVLIGSSGQAGAFTRAIVTAMAAHAERPVVLPFSNPTANAEAIPSDVLEWTSGRALVATGSPFEPVEIAGRTVEIGQGNNVFVFPGLGLGALEAGAREITDAMVSAASQALAECVTADELSRGLLFPSVPRLRAVTREVALAVAARAAADNVAERNVASLAETLDDVMWTPEYRSYRRGST